jgi:hypothetical protein
VAVPSVYEREASEPAEDVSRLTSRMVQAV